MTKVDLLRDYWLVTLLHGWLLLEYSLSIFEFLLVIAWVSHCSSIFIGRCLSSYVFLISHWMMLDYWMLLNTREYNHSV